MRERLGPLLSTDDHSGLFKWILVWLIGSLIGFGAVALAGRSPMMMGIAAVIPVGLAGLFLLVFRFEWLLIAVLLTRASIEPLLNAIKGNSEGMGPGAALNLIVLGLGVIYFLRQPRVFARSTVLAWLMFLAVCAIGVREAVDPSRAFRQFLVFATYFVMFAVPLVLVHNQADRRRWVRILVWASVVPTLWGIADLLTGGVTQIDPETLGEEAINTIPEVTGFRIMGAFTHPNIYAFFQVTLISVLMYAIHMGDLGSRPRDRWLGLAYLGLQGALLIATQTRGAWAGVAVVVLSFALFVDRRYLIYMGVAAGVLIFVPLVQDRIIEIFGGGPPREAGLNSYEWRLAMWRSALPWIEDRLLLGWGLESYTDYSMIFFPLEYTIGYDAHSVYVQMAFELGLPGLFAYLGIFIVLLWVAIGSFRQRRTESVLLIGLILSYLLACYSDNMHRYLVSNWYTFFTLGLLCVAARLPHTHEDRAGEKEGVIA